jgi:hypothetical protein
LKYYYNINKIELIKDGGRDKHVNLWDNIIELDFVFYLAYRVLIHLSQAYRDNL